MSTPATVRAGKTTGELCPYGHPIGFFSARCRLSPSLTSPMGSKPRITSPGRAPQTGQPTFWGRKARPYGEYRLSTVITERDELRRQLESQPAGESVDAASPLYKNQTIRLTDLVPRGANVIRGKVFEDCEIIGPAVITVDGPISLDSVQFTGTDQSYLIEAEVDPDRSGPDGVIYMRECSLRRCSLSQIGIIGSKAVIEEYRMRFRAKGSALPANAITGRVLRFEAIKVFNLTEAENKAFEKESNDLLGRLGTVAFDYVAQVEIENPGPATRTKDWNFGMRRTNGDIIHPVPVVRAWAAPPSWPRYEYLTLDDVKGRFLESEKVYHVILHLQVEYAIHNLDMSPHSPDAYATMI